MAAPAPASGPMALLASGVPLSLLLDLCFGPPSWEELAEEPSRSATMPAPRPA